MRSRGCGFVLVAIAATAPPGLAQAQEFSNSHLEAARELLEVTNAEALLEQSMKAARQALMMDSAQAKALAEFGSVLDEFLAEQLDWAVLEPEFVRLYVEVFTEAELRELTTFYLTDLGQKMLRRLPEVIQRSMAITQGRLQEALPRLMEQIEAKMRARGRLRQW